MNIPEAKAAVDKEWSKLKSLLAWDDIQVKPKAAVVQTAKKEGKTIHFANLVDLCHLKNAELARHLQSCKGRVVLREDNVKDEGGHRAVFAEQGASASRTWCAGEACDAVSARTQVKMTDAARLLKLPGNECPEIWIWIPPRQRSKAWHNFDDPVVPLERICTVTLRQVLFGRGSSKKYCPKWDGWKKYQHECLYVHKKHGREKLNPQTHVKKPEGRN